MPRRDGLEPAQHRAWLRYMRVYHRLEYEMNRQLQTDCGMSLGDYTVMNALMNAPQHRARLNVLATTIGWERSRLSHHLERMNRRGLVRRQPSETDGRATDAVLTGDGETAFASAAPLHAAWVKQLFFTDLTDTQLAELADILEVAYESILRHGTLPRPVIDEDRPPPRD
ncbi:MarR family winged helix-turn-helix transcriptional regulator [Mycobacterium sp. MYCO198283]|uniref:MarR family winged helix-turn-helix transcriptional regulator n=1 Tax=Mycobacterium sp. MYCO198283 TaxID=2883505 RepID=UPI001E56DFBC|nr:MarR family winged helix-turn-helix transcriptional regulator [Mycobacterium sp. MYCO198283]MCG5431939.1 MarR family winged helix-turn-helix transcriptional regulator [Mycobacterium sp. MYCO198283]